MDTITQGLLGAVTAQLGFRQRIGRDATWVGALGGIVADLDIFARPILAMTGSDVDDLTSLNAHRGISHSLLIVPILAVPIAVAWWRFRRNPRRDKAARAAPDRSPPFWLLYACVFVALLSHPLLDWCTSYGTQLLSPLTKTRFALDAVPIVDIIYTPMLILTLAACYLLTFVL